MGATLSYLGYASHQQSCPGLREHATQHFDQGCGSRCVPGNQGAASLSVIDLCTCLGATEKELLLFRVENAKKEAVIRYLLQSSNSDSNVDIKEIVVQLKEQHLALRTIINRINKESEEIKSKLRKAEEAIVTLSTLSFPGSGHQSTSTSFSSYSNCPTLGEVVTEDLIDLLGCSQEFDNAKLSEEETNLLDNFDVSENEEVLEITTPDRSVYQSFNLEHEGPSYIVHFAESDEGGNPSDSVNVPTKKLELPHKTSESVTSILEHNRNTLAFAESDNSSPDDGTNPSNILRTKCLEESSERASMSKRDGYGSLEKSIALTSKTAQVSPVINTQAQNEPLPPTSSKLQALPEKFNTSAIEPRWTISKTFKSIQDCENAASINRKNGGLNDLNYPDLFKYGVRFMPPDSQRDTYRTIIISNLSPDIHLSTLLDYIRGGLVIDAKLLDTVKITGGKSALITFLHEYAAIAFEEYAEKYPVMINSVVAKVLVVPTPTWPVRCRLRKAIFDHHSTRCLKVFNFPESIPAPKFRTDLNTHLGTSIDPITYMQERNDGLVDLHFSSIDWACKAYGMLVSWKVYRDCTPSYSADPCTRFLEPAESQRTVGVTEAESDTEPAVVEQCDRLTKVE